VKELRDNDLVRVIDALAVRKDVEGNVTKLHESQLSDEEAAAFGAVVGALIGLGAAGEEDMAAGAELGAATVGAALGMKMLPEGKRRQSVGELSGR
jgi:hypothetical protein